MSWTRSSLRVAAALVVGIATISSGRATSAAWHDAAATATWPKNASIIAMTCPGIALCFAVGGYATGRGRAGTLRGLIAQTKDGATSWTIQYFDHRRLSSFFSGVACPSTVQCYVTGGYAQDGSGVSTIFLTQDGGKTWQQSLAPFQSGPIGIACPGVTTCLIPALIFVHGPSGPGSTIILITRDGGTTWSKRRIAVGALSPHSMIACPTRRTCYVYGSIGGSCCAPGMRTAVMKTRDGGKTWRMLPGTDMLARSGVGQAFDHAMSIACPSARVCYTADGDPEGECGGCPAFGAIFGTQDGGTHWRLLYLRRKHDYLWGPIVCPGANVCYAMGTTRLSVLRDEFILSTKNAGQTWTKHMVPAGLALACPSIDVCYSAARTGPTIFRTTDGGATWQTLP